MAISLTEIIDQVLTGLNSLALLNLHRGAPAAGSNPPPTGGTAPQQANPLGFGQSDDSLFLHACAIAVRDHEVTMEQLLTIGRVIKTFSIAIQRRIILTIGQGEEGYTEVIQQPNDKEGKPVPPKKIERKGNVRGAQIIALLARMSEDQMREFLGSSGVTTSPWDVAVENVQRFRTAMAEGSSVRSAIQQMTTTLQAHHPTIKTPPPFSWWPSWPKNPFRRNPK